MEILASGKYSFLRDIFKYSRSKDDRIKKRYNENKVECLENIQSTRMLQVPYVPILFNFKNWHQL